MSSIHSYDELDALPDGTIIENGWPDTGLFYFVKKDMTVEQPETMYSAKSWSVFSVWYYCDTKGSHLKMPLGEGFEELAQHHEWYGFRTERIHLPARVYKLP